MHPESHIHYHGISNEPYTVIESTEQLIQICKDLRQYARQSEFDYDKARREALVNPTTQERAVSLAGQPATMLRTRSETDMGYMKPWTRLVEIARETFQITFYEFRVQDRWVAQLQVAHTYKMPIGDIEQDLHPAVQLITQQFIDEGSADVVVPDGTPPHVLVLFQQIER